MSMNKKSKKNAVVLLSGGLDSSTLAYFVREKVTKNIYTLTFDYGQRHKKEIKNALNVSKDISAKRHEVVGFDLTLWGESSLTDKKMKIKKKSDFTATKKKMKKSDIPNTYVPARNTIFLSFGLAYAEAVKADEIYIGVNAVDYSGYVDCRPEYIKKFQELAKLATVKGVYGKSVKIKTPLVNLSKKEIIKLGYKVGANYSLSWSCYLGGKHSCGLCDSCKLRLKGFMDAGIKDPLKYSKYPDFYKKWLSN